MRGKRGLRRAGMRKVAALLAAASFVNGVASPSSASETTSFAYDALGRLISSSNSAGPRDGRHSSINYDPAGNRTLYSSGAPAPPPTNNAVFSVSAPPTVSEGGTATFSVTKSGTAVSALSVSYATANGSAIAPGDYTAQSGTLTFQASETVKTVSVPVIDDSQAEPAEQFSLVLSAPSAGASLGTASATATIAASAAPNQPPVANPDSATIKVCNLVVVNVVANDTDPEGNYPLQVTAVSTNALGTATIHDGTTIAFAAGSRTGTAGLIYTVKDSLGAASTGMLTIIIGKGLDCQ